MTESISKLFFLEELPNYKVVDEDSDVRGWEVKDVHNRLIGIVDDLLVHKISEKVLFLDVKLDKNILENSNACINVNKDHEVYEYSINEVEEHVVFPLKLVDIDRSVDTVILHRVLSLDPNATVAKRNEEVVSKDFVKNLLHIMRPADM